MRGVTILPHPTVDDSTSASELLVSLAQASHMATPPSASHIHPSRQVVAAAVGHVVPGALLLSCSEILEEELDLRSFLSGSLWVTPLPSCFGSVQRLGLHGFLKDQLT